MTTAPPAASFPQLTGTWRLDPAHTRIGFSARHAMVATVRGSFHDVGGTLTLDGAQPTLSHAEVTIQAVSIDTGTPDRDTHLRSPDFLDVERYPTVTYVSRGVEGSAGSDEYTLRGDLTIHGVTRPVELEIEYQGTAKDPFGSLRAGFEARRRSTARTSV